MRKILTILSLAAVLNMGCGAVGSLQRCTDWVVGVNALDLQSTRGFTHVGGAGESWGLLVIANNLTAQNTVTRVDTACTGSHDGNTTDYPLQAVEISAGAGTTTDLSIRKTVSAADTWPVRFDTEGFSDLQCTIAVGAGAGTSTDVITTRWRLCTKG